MRTSDPESSVLCIHTHPEDLDELIGKDGQTARAFQAVVAVSVREMGRRLTLDIVAKQDDRNENSRTATKNLADSLEPLLLAPPCSSIALLPISNAMLEVVTLRRLFMPNYEPGLRRAKYAAMLAAPY